MNKRTEMEATAMHSEGTSKRLAWPENLLNLYKLETTLVSECGGSQLLEICYFLNNEKLFRFFKLESDMIKEMCQEY